MTVRVYRALVALMLPVGFNDAFAGELVSVYAELDRDSAALATPETPPDRRYIEYFLPGTEPAELRNNPWRVPHWGALFVPSKLVK